MKNKFIQLIIIIGTAFFLHPLKAQVKENGKEILLLQIKVVCTEKPKKITTNTASFLQDAKGNGAIVLGEAFNMPNTNKKCLILAIYKGDASDPKPLQDAIAAKKPELKTAALHISSTLDMGEPLKKTKKEGEVISGTEMAGDILDKILEAPPEAEQAEG